MSPARPRLAGLTRAARGVRFGAAAATLGAVGWYYAREVHREAFLVRPARPRRDLVVHSLEGDRVVLPDSPRDEEHLGIWGLSGDGAYGQVGPVLDRDGQQVVRRFAPLHGAFVPGQPVRLDKFAFPHDPTRALGLAYEEVRIQTADHVLPAWRIPGRGDTWLVFVHGKGSERAESLRLLSGLGTAHPPALAITYRGDAAGSERRGPGRKQLYGYGRDEWPDLEAAVAYATERGARQVVLVGYSMGGAIVANFVAQSRLAGVIAGLVLDSPMLDLNAVLDHASKQRRVPGVVTELARAVLRRRYGIDCDEFTCWAPIEALEQPLLVIHGEADPLVPVAISDRLVDSHPGDVTYHRVAGAAHVGSWNTDPKAYARAVAGFLSRIPGLPAELPAAPAAPAAADRPGLWLD